jgi:hypothetical protein
MMRAKIYHFSLMWCIILFGLTTTIQASKSPFSSFKKYVFGRVTPSEGLESFQECADMFEVEDREYYYTQWPWNCFSTFTFFGDTWITKQMWDEASATEQIFVSCHETVHAHKKHSMKQLIVFAVTTALVACGMHMRGSELICNAFFDRNLPQSGKKIKQIVTVSASLLSALLTTFWYTQECEKEADVETIKKLLQEGRKDIVDAELERLKNRLDEGETDIVSKLCFGSLLWRIAYFQKTIDHYSDDLTV